MPATWRSAGLDRWCMTQASSVGNIKLFEDRTTTDSDHIDSLSSNPKFLELVDSLTREKVDEFLPVRCPDTTVAKRMEDKIAELRDQHDSTGGTVTCIIRGCPSGLGELCFDELEALLAHAIVEAMAAMTFADALMAQHARQMAVKIAAAGR